MIKGKGIIKPTTVKCKYCHKLFQAQSNKKKVCFDCKTRKSKARNYKKVIVDKLGMEYTIERICKHCGNIFLAETKMKKVCIDCKMKMRNEFSKLAYRKKCKKIKNN